ncbi:uncharacterized protein EI90DRAFT_3289489 [Cantharellus anzutake]|uniref:uncharacterized protein n=1 Tax=Cantharellus anzutake TaxID=1750568 RepID=UPI001902D20E|nr:uncharacterized protein EI90DRAFT_3289489 [Cantharellus anzutake]KAF8331423.1 hypothetical protein EI90DRAFT_3289489 [Cantharellus anzutake]
MLTAPSKFDPCRDLSNPLALLSLRHTMRTSAFTSALSLIFGLLLISPTRALISSISAPTEVLHPGDKFNVTAHTTPSLNQNNHQFYAIFGITPAPGEPGTMGILIPVVCTGHGRSGHKGNDSKGADKTKTWGHEVEGVELWMGGMGNMTEFNVTLELPKNLNTTKTQAEFLLQTSVFGVVGAFGNATLSFYNTTIKIESS